MNHKKILWTGLCLMVLITFLVPVVRADYENTINKSFNVKPGGQLKLYSERGSIEVTTSPRNKVEVEIYLDVDSFSKGEADEILENFEIDFQQSGDDVIIDARFRKGFSSFFDKIRNRLKVRYVITVPEKYNLDLQTSGGSISVSDLEGTAMCRTSGGSLTFGNIKGPVTGKTSGGSINLEGCVGDAEITTSGGGITIGEVNGDVVAHTSGGSIRIEQARGTVDATTSGGGITVNEVMGTINASTSGGSINATISKQPTGNCSLKTSGGSIMVYLAEGINIDLDASTSGGNVSTDFPIRVQGTISKNSLVAQVNEGGPELYLRTSGGSIKLHKM